MPHAYDLLEKKKLSNAIHQAPRAVDAGEVVKIGFLGNLFKPPKVPGYDVLKAFKAVYEAGCKVNLVAYGGGDPESLKIVERGFNEVITLQGRTDHLASLRQVQTCDFLLLALSDRPICKGVIHAKLPHYLILNKPIIAIVPKESAVTDIIKETNTGYVIPADSDWSENLLKLFNSYRRGGFGLKRNQQAIDRYSWDYLSKQWLEIIAKKVDN